MKKNFVDKQSAHQTTILLWLFLILLFIVIIIWRSSAEFTRPGIESLAKAPSESNMTFLAASDQSFVYRGLLFWLQQFDVQDGRYISYRQIDYSNLKAWLEFLQKMEPSSQYPVLLAARIYSKVADEVRVKIMMDFVYQQFLLNPEKNWRWLTEVVVIARHRLKDLPLALKYANAISEYGGKNIPFWAKDMRLTILEDMGEYERVKLLVGGLIASKTITDVNEIRFLELLLHRLHKKNKNLD